MLSQMESDFRRERKLERQTTNKHKQSAIEKTKRVEEGERLQEEGRKKNPQQMVKSRKKQIETQVAHLPV